MSHVHNVIDKDRYFVIDPVTKTISNESKKVVIAQYDHNSERYSFEIPRYVEEHDMSLCDRVEVHFTNITRNKKERRDDVYIVPEALESDRDTVFFSWLVSSNATQLIGSLKFSIVFLCFDEEGNTTYEWGTEIFDGIQVIERLRNTAAVIESQPDLLVQLKKDILASIPSGGGLTAEDVEKIVDEHLKQYPLPEDGVDGKDGEDGYSPTVSVETIENGYKVTITDVNGSNSFDIFHGANGKDGVDGKDGYTPVKGLDYYTESEKDELIKEIMSLLLSSADLRQLVKDLINELDDPSSSGLNELILLLGGDSDESDIVASIDGSEYPVMNTDSPTVLDENTYAVEIKN